MKAFTILWIPSAPPRSLVLRRVLSPVGAGLLLTRGDPLTLVAVGLLLVAAAVVAALVP